MVVNLDLYTCDEWEAEGPGEREGPGGPEEAEGPEEPEEPEEGPESAEGPEGPEEALTRVLSKDPIHPGACPLEWRMSRI